MRTKAECKKDSIRLGGRGGMKSHVWLQYLPINVLAGGNGKNPSLDEPIGI
jgi:hypothetical protein